MFNKADFRKTEKIPWTELLNESNNLNRDLFYRELKKK